MTARSPLLAPLRSLHRMQPSDWPLELPLACSLAAGLPLLAGLGLGQVNAGLAGSLGGMALVYLPRTPLLDRMRVVALCALAMIACHAGGLWLAGRGWWAVAGIGVLTMGAAAFCRLLQRSPPGSLFLVMPAAIAAAGPPLVPAQAVPQIAALAAGCAGALVLGLLYSVHIGRRRARLPVQPLAEARATIWREAALLGACVALALALATWAGLPRPYWAAISTLTVMQGATVAQSWQRKVHRVVGTLAGLAIAAPLLLLIATPLQAAIAIAVLLFLVEMLVVRHYALAVAFITPMAILLAEFAALAGTGGIADPAGVLLARVADTLLGAAIGVGGMALQVALAQRYAIRGHAKRVAR